MAGLRNITHLPHAEAKVALPPSIDSVGTAALDDRSEALALALRKAARSFADEYKRQPDWDLLSFRGCFTTFDALVEIWEEA